jgi:hypothetical protein
MIAGPKLKIGSGHDLRLHAAHVAADGNQICARIVQQVVTPEAEGGDALSPNLWRRFGHRLSDFRLCIAGWRVSSVRWCTNFAEQKAFGRVRKDKQNRS